MSRSPTLVVYGDATLDIFVRVPTLPEPGGDAEVESFAMLPGGSAANCAAVAARLGAAVRFVGLVGRDDPGDLLRRDLSACGVDVAALRQADGASGAVVILVDHSGQPTFLSFRGAAASLPYGSLPPEVLCPGDHLHVSGYCFQTPESRETARALMAIAQRVGATVSLDPSYTFARRVMAEYPDALEGLRFLFPNQLEAGLMSGLDDPGGAAQHLLDKGAQVVLLKMGSAGCLIADGEGSVAVAARAVSDVVDMTGAGDAFAGGFLAAVLKGATLEEAARIGNAASAVVIGQLGGHSAAPTAAQLLELAQRQDDERLLSALERLR